jgi:hypothetical protein
VTVNFEFTSEIQIKDNNIRPLRFESKEIKQGKTSLITYHFDYDSSFIDIKKTGFEGLIEYEKRMPIYAVYQDGLSIFYYARYNYFKDYTKDVPVLFNQDSSSIEINYNIIKKDIDIGAVDYDISSLLLQGSTNYQLVFGLTGEFSGWFTSDATRIPVKAKFKVKIGNVTLELKSWQRRNWVPPKY